MNIIMMQEINSKILFPVLHGATKADVSRTYQLFVGNPTNNCVFETIRTVKPTDHDYDSKLNWINSIFS